MNAHVTVNFNAPTGKSVMPLHGFNSGPMTKVFTYDARPWFKDGGFPFVRLHDVEYPYGSGEFVDIPCIFKNFDADENDPASYNFANTDEYIRQSLAVGAKILYRLGVSIEHSPHKRYIDPPKDYAKWARICEHIIMHYNEGWADGYRYGIEYWEIWNEPDLHSGEPYEKQTTWTGTLDDLVEFYTVTATYLKSRFPDLKIGGCGFASAYKPYIVGFFEKLSQKTPRVPMDFYSWHAYKGDPADYPVRAASARNLLDTYGYSDTESVLDEWNLMYEWGPRVKQSKSYPAMKDERGAAFYAATLAALQEQTDVALATNFEADVVKEFCGIFDVDEMCIGGLTKSVEDEYFATVKPTKGYYAFRQFNLLYRMGEQAETVSDNERIFATAARGSGKTGVLLSNPNSESAEVLLDMEGVVGPVIVRQTDKDLTNEIVMRIVDDGPIAIPLILPPQSFVYVGTRETPEEMRI